MANQITGRIEKIMPIQEIPSKNGGTPFYKREVVIDATRFDPYTGERGFDNFPCIEFTGERCKDLDAYQEGQVVTVSFDLQGRKWVKDGVEKYITAVRGYKIELRQATGQQPTQSAQPLQPQQNQQPQQYAPERQYQQPAPQPPFPPAQPSQQSDLPF